MPTYKLSTLFSLTTAISNPGNPLHRSAGWSETIYGNFASVQALLAEAARQGPAQGNFGSAFTPGGLWLSRASLLPKGGVIIGYRIQQVDVPGPSQTGALSYAGDFAQETDQPQNALLIRSPGIGVNNIRRFTLRCIPDNQMSEGEYQPQSNYAGLMANYISQLGNWAFRAKVFPAAKVKIINITAAGVATLEAVPTFVPNQMIKVTKSRDSGGNLRSGRYIISTVGPATTVTLIAWQWGATTGGTMSGDAVIQYPAIDPVNTQISRAVVRKVGRPFVGYRGRRSKRR